jgi:hypothetical protein
MSLPLLKPHLPKAKPIALARSWATPATSYLQQSNP